MFAKFKEIRKRENTRRLDKHQNGKTKEPFKIGKFSTRRRQFGYKLIGRGLYGRIFRSEVQI